jgi:hypothetical protein
MKYTEFENDICSLGADYRVTQNDDYVYVVYRDNEILRVYTQNTFRLVSYDELRNCPKKQEVWNEATLLAATPLDEREEEQKYNVIIGNDDTVFPYMAWDKNNVKKYVLSSASFSDLTYPDFQFTEFEFQNLLKYIKSLPQGDKQVKIAKIGKTLVKGE